MRTTVGKEPERGDPDAMVRVADDGAASDGGESDGSARPTPSFRRVRVAVGAVVALLYAPAVWSVGIRTDMGTHLVLAEQLSLTGQSPSPYNLFQQLTIALRAFLPFGEIGKVVPSLAERGHTWEISGTIVIVASAVATADLVLVRLLRRAPDVQQRWLVPCCAVATVGAMIATPVTLLTMGERQLVAGYVNLTMYHNATTMISRPFALAIFWLVAQHIYGRAERRTVSVMAVISVLVILAKPSYSVCLLPAVPLVLVSWWERIRSVDRRALGLGFFLPSAVLLGLQATGGSGTDSVGLTLAPFEVVRNTLEPRGQSPWLFAPFVVLSLLFPIVVAASTRGIAKGVAWRLAWVTLGVGLTFFSLFEITTFDDPGDLMWGANVASFILFVESIAVSLQVFGPGTASTLPRHRLRRSAVATAFALHVVCGIVFLIAEVRAPAQWW